MNINRSSVISAAVVFLVGLCVVVSPPPGAIGPYLDGVFPDSPPGADSKWKLEDATPDLALDLTIKLLPLPNSDDVLLLSKAGIISQLSLTDQSIRVLLDMSDQVCRISDAGMLGMALHPHFGDPSHPDKHLIFVFYKYNPEPAVWVHQGGGNNRLSKFTWDPITETFSRASEEILMQQYDRSCWHDGGGMFFDNDGFLNLTVGDEGHWPYQQTTTQRRDAGFFSGVLRIDVDNDPTRSHPIRRQPIGGGPYEEAWGPTYSQGYMIPNDNPWLSPDSSKLEEYIALGLRSPYSTYYDEEQNNIWIADVGSDKAEEINVFRAGANLQWPYMEGEVPSTTDSKPADLEGEEVPPLLVLRREDANCVIGGGIYRGTVFQELNEKYIFSNFGMPKLMAMTNNGISNEPTYEILLSNVDFAALGLPSSSRIVGIYLHYDGNIYVTVIASDTDPTSKILKLSRNSEIPDPPARLSDLVVFTDMQSLTVRAGILPYDVNAPLYSDDAEKRRWMAIPNDGSFDTADERIKFNGQGNWKFPEGTVFIKHFELPIHTDKDGPNVKLETRFFIVGKGGRGYGLTYKWNEDGSEAYLQSGGSTRDIDVYTDDQWAYTQTWEYPSRAQCITCHNDNAEYVLGVRTHQLNGEVEYPFSNEKVNQLDYMRNSGMFTTEIGPSGALQKSYAIDDISAPLETRIASYLDANCASCHQNDGIPDINLDFRYNSANDIKNYIDFPTASHASISDRPIITLGAHEESEIWVRDASYDTNKMPPLGRTFVDQVYVDSLAKWIDNIDENDIPDHHDLMIFPNPTSDWLVVRVDDDWTAPFTMNITSMSGRPIRVIETDNPVSYLELQNLTSGTYLLTVTAGDRRQSKKFGNYSGILTLKVGVPAIEENTSRALPLFLRIVS